jgi:amino acid transporter
VHERLGKPTALAVFASDNLSSSAYATEEILRVLMFAGLGAATFTKVVPITVALLVVLAILLFSYRQTIRAYPQAGGAYLVTRDNFGLKPAQVAGVALLTDYVLTVSVSAAAGTAALTSIYEPLHPWRVPISLGFIAMLTWGNLRGVRESGRMFALPTYFFLAMMAVLLGVSFFRLFSGSLPEQASRFPVPETQSFAGLALLFLILRAFASGGPRSLEWRRSPTACPPSETRSGRTPSRRSCGWARFSASCSLASRYLPCTCTSSRTLTRK